MQIETYEIEEINSSEASSMAADSAAIELIEKLGLTGQQTLVNTDTSTRFPYPRMTKVQELVYKACFPQATKLHEFSHEIIPLRVLQVAAFCKDFPQTGFLEVWHSSIPKQDPVLVGRKEQWNSENYLLARWGDSLPSFEQLIAKAKPILIARYNTKLAKIKAKVSELEHELTCAVDEAVLTGEEPSFSIYV